MYDELEVVVFLIFRVNVVIGVGYYFHGIWCYCWDCFYLVERNGSFGDFKCSWELDILSNSLDGLQNKAHILLEGPCLLCKVSEVCWSPQRTQRGMLLQYVLYMTIVQAIHKLCGTYLFFYFRSLNFDICVAKEL